MRETLVRRLQFYGRMALREFSDANGRAWRVWHTVPARTDGLTPKYHGGWLTFDADGERRRLAPVPSDWAMLPQERLILLLRMAEPVALLDPELTTPKPERRKAERRRGDRRNGRRNLER